MSTSVCNREKMKNMNKTVTGDQRDLVHRMLSNFQSAAHEIQQINDQRNEYYNEILLRTQELSDDNRYAVINCINKIKDLDKVYSTETAYMKQISSMTSIGVRTIKKIKSEGKTNSGIWVTPGKKHKSNLTKRNVDDFDKAVIHNLINEYYTVRNEVPTLRKLLVDLQKTIQFKGSRETLRLILHDMGITFEKTEKQWDTELKFLKKPKKS